MKIAHLADLHIGKRVNEFSMIEDQKYILKQILQIIDSQKIEVVMIAGDVYDKAVPPESAVNLLDDFLTNLAQRNIKTFVISGNHDSSERIAFGSRLMKSKGIYMAQNDPKNIKAIAISDNIDIYMLPFVKMGQVKMAFENENIENYSDAIKTVLNSLNVDKSKKNILIAHQFVTGASTCDSEELFVGGSENVDSEVFKDFDYVALGHLHSPQYISKKSIRYSGSPLKYSFSEAKQKKSLTILDVNENIEITETALIPKRDLKEIKGECSELVAVLQKDEDYIHAILTDEEDVLDALSKLRSVYPNLMKISYDNTRTRNNKEFVFKEKVPEQKPIDLFSDFYQMQNNKELSERQKEILTKMIDEIWGEKNEAN